LPFGIEPDAEYTQEAILLHPDDIVALLTDGIFDASTLYRERLGEVGFQGILVELAARAPVEEVADAIWDGVRRFGAWTDDATLVLIRFEEPQV
jgi:serine phosphatase RsbU (regulator of sigma subunit)